MVWPCYEERKIISYNNGYKNGRRKGIGGLTNRRLDAIASDTSIRTASVHK